LIVVQSGFKEQLPYTRFKQYFQNIFLLYQDNSPDQPVIDRIKAVLSQFYGMMRHAVLYINLIPYRIQENDHTRVTTINNGITRTLFTS